MKIVLGILSCVLMMAFSASPTDDVAPHNEQGDLSPQKCVISPDGFSPWDNSAGAITIGDGLVAHSFLHGPSFPFTLTNRVILEEWSGVLTSAHKTVHIMCCRDTSDDTDAGAFVSILTERGWEACEPAPPATVPPGPGLSDYTFAVPSGLSGYHVFKMKIQFSGWQYPCELYLDGVMIGR